MPRLLIIGYGNTLLGDDAFGPIAAEQLRALIPDPEVEILTLPQLAPELMEGVSRATRVIFLDAALGGFPGTIRERGLSSDPEPCSFTHHLTPYSLLAGTRALYGSAPSAILITVTAASFAFGQGLSQPVQAALPAVIRACCRLASPLHSG